MHALLERMLMLQVVDTQWKDHLLALDHLKEGIGLRGYGQKDPLVEYKKESFDMFNELLGPHRRGDDPAHLARGRPLRAQPATRKPRSEGKRQNLQLQHAALTPGGRPSPRPW